MDKRVKRIVIVMWAVTAVAAAALGGAVWMMRSAGGSGPAISAAESPTAGLPVLFDAPSFSLTDQNGQSFDSAGLHGKVWVADFIFTSCAGICPMMTQHMRAFQKLTPDSPVQIVSFSVDPGHDTPAVLKQYAEAAKADEARWHFLTGESRAKLWDICKAMKLAVGPDTNNQVMHSNQFLLIDGDGHVRGVYNSEDDSFLPKLVADANTLTK
ncbi:MAG TPA: SCO family protein [Tepidisphaeraceae bacterium]|nr:SCO family protein [Tepidisphaeraceae bacterium]